MDDKPDMGAALPLITPELPGIGGEIKARPAHFAVWELPLYTPSGEGDHVYLTLEREGHATRDLAGGLAAAFGLEVDAVGYAGLKDSKPGCARLFRCT